MRAPPITSLQALFLACLDRDLSVEEIRGRFRKAGLQLSQQGCTDMARRLRRLQFIEHRRGAPNVIGVKNGLLYRATAAGEKALTETKAFYARL